MVIKNHSHVYFLDSKYEFESNSREATDAFLRILEDFGLTAEDVYIAELGVDFSQISFRTSRDIRLRIEYTLREFLGLSPIYLLDVDQRESSIELTCDDGYVIF